MYKCKYCSYKTHSKDDLVSHIRNNHPYNASCYEDDDDLLSNTIADSVVDAMINIFNSFDLSSNDSFSGGGGDFGGGGANGDW